MGLVTKKDHTFDGHVKLPSAAGDISAVADRDIWINTAAGKLAVRIAGATVLVPLASEIGGGGGFTQEQIEDFMAVMIDDNSILDWTYTDNGASPGTLAATIKPGVLTNTEFANMAQATIKGRAAGAGTGPPVDLTAAQVKTLLAVVAADISDFVTVARTSISVTDTSTLDLSYAAGAISGVVLDSPKLEGNSLAQVQAAVIAAISAGASAAYDTLLEIQALLEADDTADALISAGLAVRARFFAGAVPNGAATANIDHNLNLTNIHDFTARVFVSATGAEEEYAMVGSTADRVILTDETGSNIASGRRIFLTAGV